jgi:hypothetical protein
VRGGHGDALVEVLLGLSPGASMHHHTQGALEQIISLHDGVTATLHRAHPAVIELTRIKSLSTSPAFFHVRSMSKSRDVSTCVSRRMNHEFEHEDKVVTRGGEGVPHIAARLHSHDATDHPHLVATSKCTPRLAVSARPLR